MWSTLTLTKHNAGEYRHHIRKDITRDIFAHPKTTKKIRAQTSNGDMKEQLTKTSTTDHWVHALNYAGIAAMVVEDLGDGHGIGIAPMVGQVQVGSRAPSVLEARASGKPIRSGW